MGSDNTNPINQCLYELKNQIEILREEMISIGLSKGLCNEQTILISEKLDHYIAVYLSLKNYINELCYLKQMDN
ncbi:aspartyl-phosphate phosphatase Spo0E family protein [Neobacillus niacini]|uniref:aspartyl-phosphate phosphatase Spo0E family protein n=1 Tax=Neobacillus niacini TaxID=86668 RepID=UPI00351C14DA